jgi:hypothetical protein
MDDPTFKWLVPTKDGGIEMDCEFITKKGIQDVQCEKKWKDINGVFRGAVKDLCVKACNNCKTRIS